MIRSIALGGALATVCIAGFARAQTAPAPPAAPAFAPAVVKQVKPGLYMIIGNGGNSVVRVGDDGVILVDTKNPGQAIFDDLVAKIKSITDLPVKDVFITHVHNDHSGNTVRFEALGVPVIADDHEKELLKTYSLPPAPHSADPSVTFAASYAVKIKGASATAYHFAPAHTGGDAIVYFPDIKAVAVGDEGAAVPNVDYPNGGSVLGWQQSLAAVDKLDFDTVIGGHGDNPMTREQFEVYRQKVATLIERARALVKAGTPKDQLMAKLKIDDLWPINIAQWSQPGRLDPFYAEMSK